MMGELGFIWSLKRHFWAQKGGFKEMVLVHGESYELLVVRILSSKKPI
jgi:hypothetical protein